MNKQTGLSTATQHYFAAQHQQQQLIAINKTESSKNEILGKNNSSQAISSSNGEDASSAMMDAANAAGVTVLACTLALGIVFLTVALFKARSKYKEYMLGSTNAPHQKTTTDHGQEQYTGEKYAVITLYPTFPPPHLKENDKKESLSKIAEAADELLDDHLQEKKGYEEEEDEETTIIHESNVQVAK